mgnify:CR=1 FL=1
MSILIALACTLAATAEAPAYTTAGDTVQLFNGKNLDGWYTYLKDRGRNVDPNVVFSVAEGAIHISGQEFGCITSDAEFENFRIVVEFKWGGKTCPPRVENARDSGLLLHSTGADGAYGGMWMHSMEFQIIEGGTGDFLVVGDGSDAFSLTSPILPRKEGGPNIFHPGGTPETIHGGRIDWYDRDPAWKDVRGFRGAKDVEKPFGEWNTIEGIALGDTLTAIVNGVVVNQARGVTPHKGRIQIQSEAAEILIRRVEITPIAPK